jgi:hypothetical protein
LLLPTNSSSDSDARFSVIAVVVITLLCIATTAVFTFGYVHWYYARKPLANDASNSHSDKGRDAAMAGNADVEQFEQALHASGNITDTTSDAIIIAAENKDFRHPHSRYQISITNQNNNNNELARLLTVGSLEILLDKILGVY